jgi:hypothetical protein
MGIADFKGTSHWCHSFMKKANLTVRATTSVGQKISDDYQEKIARFRQYVNVECRGINLSNVGNMDEVPVSFDLPRRFTVDERGFQDVRVDTTGAEKANFTVVLGITANGNKCPPMIIFRRKTVPKERFPPGVVVKANEHGWMNDQILGEWIKECWCERPNPNPDPSKSLLILDSARSHLTEMAKESIRQASKIAVIPGGLTKFLQPLDIAVNKSFKSHLRMKWEAWMSQDAEHTFTATGRMRRASYSEVARWVADSFEAVPVECLKNGFKKALDEENGLMSDLEISFSDLNVDE